MMIKRLLILFIFLFFYSTNVFSSDKTVFIDIEKTIKLSNAGKSIVEELKKKQIENKKKIEIQKNKIFSEENEIKKLKNIITKDDLKKKISILQKNVNDFNNDKNKINEEFNRMKNNFFVEQMKIITPVVKQYMEDNNIDIVIEKKNIFIANSEKDITNNIIELLNKND